VEGGDQLLDLGQFLRRDRAQARAVGHRRQAGREAAVVVDGGLDDIGGAAEVVADQGIAERPDRPAVGVGCRLDGQFDLGVEAAGAVVHIG